MHRFAALIPIHLRIYMFQWDHDPNALKCRTRHPVTSGNPLFQLQGGHGCNSPSLSIFAMLMTVEGHSLTQICRELSVSEQWARRWRTRARSIRPMHAEELQKAITFGQLPDGAPAYMEVDETCVSSWRCRREGEAEDTWTWYVWLGFVQRSDPSSLWLKPMPLRTSKGVQ